MNTGEILKSLRGERSMTQSEVAEALGVMVQAVSKWECGGGMPDVSQLVPLADLFGVSVDALLGHDPDEKEREILRILDAAEHSLRDVGKWSEMVDMLRSALRKYPKDYRLMEALCNALYFFPKEGGFDGAPESYRCAHECIEWAQRILDGCTDNALRGSATTWMLRQYEWLGSATTRCCA